jgi:hypothetical protein
VLRGLRAGALMCWIAAYDLTKRQCTRRDFRDVVLYFLDRELNAKNAALAVVAE